LQTNLHAILVNLLLEW